MEKEKLFSEIAKSICDLSNYHDSPTQSGAHAAAIVQLIQAPHTTMDDIQTALNKQPIRALTLLTLLYGENHFSAKSEAGVQRYLTEIEKKKTATKGADAKHNKPGGSREKQQKIRDIWATGKYTNRTRCAEEECAALDMSYDAARKALRNTPDPI